MSSPEAKAHAGQANPWSRPNWTYQGLASVFKARFEAEHQALERKHIRLLGYRPYALGVVFILAFLLGDRGCVFLTADDPVPFLHYAAGAVLGLIMMSIAFMFFEPGDQDVARRRLDAFFDQCLEEAHPKSPLVVEVLGDPNPEVLKAWKTARSPYSGAEKRYFRFCQMRCSYVLRNGIQVHLEMWRAMKTKSQSTVRDNAQVRVVLQIPGQLLPSDGMVQALLPPKGWQWKQKAEPDGAVRILASKEGASNQLLPEKALGHLLSEVGQLWRS